MVTSVALSLAVSMLLAPTPHATADTLLKKVVLGDGIYLFQAPSALDIWTATNVIVIVNDQDVTVFDSNTRPKTARMVLAEIRKLTDKPVRWLINSHWHMDHWSGNGEYVKAYPGVQIVATIEQRNYMTRMSGRFFAREASTGLPRAQATLDAAIHAGKLSDGSPLTAERRRAMQADIDETQQFADEIAAVPRVLPTVAYRDTMIFWSGRREFRLLSANGDSPASTVLYLPAERLLVAGDVVIAPEDGRGPPPWSVGSYAVSARLASLRALEALDVDVIVPGQGPAFHDKNYLSLTVDLYATILSQVHSAFEHGSVTLAEVQHAVNVDSIGRRFTQGSSPPDSFQGWVRDLTLKAYQEWTDNHVLE
jgi:cyclase